MQSRFPHLGKSQGFWIHIRNAVEESRPGKTTFPIMVSPLLSSQYNNYIFFRFFYHIDHYRVLGRDPSAMQ